MDKMHKTNQNVLTMSDYQTHSGHAPLAQVEAYWEALRAGRDMPRRADIDPRGIESALEFAFILERVAPGVARMRIAGHHLHMLMGMEARGMPLTSFFRSDDRQRISDMLEEVFQTPATAQLSMTGGAGSPLDARMILLPLKSDLGDVSRILGCLMSKGDIGQAPRRLTLRSATVHALDIAPRRLLPAADTDSKQHSGFEDSATPFGHADTTKKRPPYLRLIKSSD